ISPGQPPEDDAQTVVGQFHVTKGLPAKGLERMLMRLSPVLHAHLAVIGLGKDKGHPGASKPAVGETLVEMMVAKMTLHHLRQLQLLHQTNQQGNVVYTLVLKYSVVYHEF